MMVAGCCHVQAHSAFRTIHQAVIDGNVAGVKEDLKLHPEHLNLPDDFGQTPLHLAAVHCRINVLALLLGNGAKIEAFAKSNATPLHLAAQSGCAAAVVMLLQKGAEVNPRDSDNRTPLGRAKRWHQDGIVTILREHGGEE